MAVQAINGETRSAVVRIVGGFVGGTMAADAFQRQISIAPGGMAGLAIQFCVNSHQWKPGDAVIALHRSRIKPAIGCVAIRASRSKLTAMDIAVTVVALGARR